MAIGVDAADLQARTGCGKLRFRYRASL